jgi:hypothetical protein
MPPPMMAMRDIGSRFAIRLSLFPSWLQVPGCRLGA